MPNGAHPIDLRVLFRFRDLTDHTVERHREVIAQNGACWWGWWKRPTEQERGDIWTFLSEQIAANGSVRVGLFDSGAGNDAQAVRTALVTAVIPPVQGAATSPAVPDGEAALIPEYYRKSPFSRAWLKMTDIDEHPIAFFNQYSFDVPPPLPNIPEQYLSQLQGKKILDSAELRAMDITIWRIRPAQPGDMTDRFLAPSIRVLKPTSSEPIAVRGSAILHLTDLHFAAGAHAAQHKWDLAAGGPRGTLAEQVGSAVSNLGIGIVIVSGDFTFIAHADEFAAAERSINAILGTLGLGPDHLVIIPGNHDIAWTNTAAGYDPKVPVAFAPAAARQAYEAFYRRLMRHSPNSDLSMARRFVLPDGHVVDVCALNSSSLEQGANYLAGMGRVTPMAFGRVRQALGWNDHRASGLRIVAVHHHLTATEDVENPAEYSSGFGMAIDAKKILRDAANYGAQLVLHGHRHRTFVWNEGVYARPEFNEPKWNLGRVAIIGGGSVGSTSVDGNRNFFNVIKVVPGSVNVSMFRSANDAPFELMTTWIAKTSLADGQLQLSDWDPE